MTYRLTRRASQNIREIARFIAMHDVSAALRFRTAVMRACDTLGDSPMLGHTRNDLTSLDLRFWPVGHLRVVHRGRDPVEIVAVLDTRRDLRKLLR